MGKYVDRYITKEEFEAFCATRRLYEGFVIGMGYAYCETHVITPTHLHGSGSLPVWGNRPAAYTHNIIAHDQCLDSSHYAIFRSLRLTPDDFTKVLVGQTNHGTTVNMGNGKAFSIPSAANHRIEIDIADNGHEMAIRVRAENLDTNERHETTCLMKDFPLVFNTFPQPPSSVPANREQGVGQPGFWESMIPMWGSGRAAVDHFQNGNYWRGALYTLLAVSDVFLVKSIATGLAKGAFKIAGSHTWGATRRWMLKHGYVSKGEPLHHFLLTQEMANKYGLEAFANQPWNLVRFSTQSMHMRAGHGTMYLGEEGFGMVGRFWYGTPTWYKAAGASGLGRGAIISGDNIYDIYNHHDSISSPYYLNSRNQSE